MGRSVKKHHTPQKGKSKDEYQHDVERAPKLSEDGTTIVDIRRAPRHIRIGDMKPGHNITARKDGLDQIGNYVSGIEAVRKAVNDAPDSMKQGLPKTWSLTIETMNATRLKIPDEVHPKKLRAKTKHRLRMHYQGESIVPDTEVRGQMVIAKDRKHPGIWVYVWVPTTDFRALGGQPELVAIATLLETKIIKPLGVSPLSKRVSKRSAAPAQTGTARAIVQRRKSTAATSDAFNYKTWERDRDDIAKKWPHGALTTAAPAKGSGPRFSRGERGDVVTSVGAAEAADLYRENFVDPEDKALDLKAPERGAGAATTERDVRRLGFWLSLKGKTVGLLRRFLGKTFVAGHNAFLRFKAIFQKNKKLKWGGRATSLIQAALKALMRILVIVGGAVVNRTAQIMAGALVSSAEKRVQAVFGGDIEAVEQEIKAFEIRGVTVDQMASMDGKQLATLFLGDELGALVEELDDNRISEMLFGPFEKHVDTIVSVMDGLSKASSILSIITWAIRVVACLSPPAIGCLWLIAEAAVSWALSMFLSSCWFLREVYPHIASLSVVTDISSTLAKTALGKLQELIPRRFLGDINLADAVTEAAAEKPDASDVEQECDRSGREPSAEERALAEMLENLPAAKLAALQEHALKHGWKPGTEIDLARAREMIEYLEKTEIEQIKLDLEKTRLATSDAPGPLKKADEAARGGSQGTQESVEESAKRKAGGEGEGAAGGGGDEGKGEEEGAGGGGEGGGSGKKGTGGSGGVEPLKQEVTPGLLSAGEDTTPVFTLKTHLDLPATVTKKIERRVTLDIRAGGVRYENIVAQVFITATEKDEAGGRVAVFRFKQGFTVSKEFSDKSFTKWSPDKNLGPYRVSY